MKLSMVTRLTSIAVVCLAATALGQPATQPMGPRRPFGDPPGGRRMLTEEERQQLDNWSREHMPHLYQLMAESEFPRRRALRQYAVTRMRAIQQAKDDPRLTEKLVNDLKAEDEIFKCLAALDHASADQRPAAIEDLRSAVRQVVEGMLAERAERIARLKARLEDEEARLAADQARLDEVVERRMRQFMPPWAQPDTPAAPEGDSTTSPGQ